MTRIVVTGRQSPTQRALIHALADRGHTVFSTALHPRARTLVDVPSPGDVDFLPMVHHAACSLDAPVVLPTGPDDLRELARGRRVFGEDGITVVAAEPRILGPVLDRAVVASRCAARGLAPRTVLLDEYWSYRGPRPVLAVSRRAHLERRIDAPADLRGLPRDGTFLIQECLDGPEVTVDVLAHPDSGQPLAAAASCSTRSGRHGPVDEPELVVRATKLVADFRLEWMSSVRFQRRADGSCVVTDLRPQFGPTIDIIAAAGMLDWVVARASGAVPPALCPPVFTPTPTLAMAS